jgi:D-3-phosphoglycerate dehydrogenase
LTDPFAVYVTRDDRLPERDYDMGLGALEDDPDIEVTYLPPRDTGVIPTEELRGADGVVSLKDKITAETLAGLDSLEIIARFGPGYDNVDIGACTERGIVVTNAPQGVRESVAQATVGMLVVCASHMRRYDNIVRSKGFDERLENMGVELFGKTLGLVGTGQIGSRVLDLLEPFDMDALAYDPYMSEERAAELGVEKVDLDTLLETSDIVTIHVPLTEETHHMLGREDFERMQDSAYLVNTSRGGIYPDEELASALDAGELRGAAIDVLEGEPDVEGNPLLDIEDVHLTPHIAGLTTDAVRRMHELMAESIVRLKRGEPPINVLNPPAYETVAGEALPEDCYAPSFRQ